MVDCNNNKKNEKYLNQKEIISHLVERMKAQQKLINKQQKQIDILIDKMNKINKKIS